MMKQIVIVRKDLGMSIGKACAQVSHASMAFLTWMIRDHVIGEVYEGTGGGQKFMEPAYFYRIESFDIGKELYEQWIDGEFTKVVLQARNKNHLLKAKTMAEEIGMEEGKDFFLIRDNCHTELEPEEFDENGVGRTLTCIGFRPMDSETIDQIGRKYHLYV
jgi:PTH2 family peptidyl-tRNA hydrolase